MTNQRQSPTDNSRPSTTGKRRKSGSRILLILGNLSLLLFFGIPLITGCSDDPAIEKDPASVEQRRQEFGNRTQREIDEN